jgi:hypothetical protein
MSNPTTRREYVPAYRARSGNIIAIGHPTRDRKTAEHEAESLRRSDPGDVDPIFVAFRDLPDWQPAPLAGGDVK